MRARQAAPVIYGRGTCGVHSRLRHADRSSVLQRIENFRNASQAFVPRYGVMAIAWSMDKIGPMCRTADCCGLVLSAIAGHDPKDHDSLSSRCACVHIFECALGAAEIGRVANTSGGDSQIFRSPSMKRSNFSAAQAHRLEANHDLLDRAPRSRRAPTRSNRRCDTSARFYPSTMRSPSRRIGRAAKAGTHSGNSALREGQIIDPRVSEPRVNAASPAPIIAPEPLDEPHVQ